MGLNIKLEEEEDVAVLDNVLLAFGAEEGLFFDSLSVAARGLLALLQTPARTLMV
jgi:hypothetical protein